MSSLSKSPSMDNSVNSNKSNKLITRQYLETTGKSRINEFLNLDKKTGKTLKCLNFCLNNKIQCHKLSLQTSLHSLSSLTNVIIK